MGGAPSRILDTTLVQGGLDVGPSDWFETEGITHVVSICHESPGTFTDECRIHINVTDEPSTNLSPHFVRTSEFIHNARINEGRVYVHCAAGISRSSTITLAYLMAWLDVGFNEAMADLRLARRGVSPNEGFRQQLRTWEASEERKALAVKFRALREADSKVQALYEHDLKVIASRKAQAASTNNTDDDF
eukprot:TRINITY_DN3314_c0_g1_i1.p1 TRINITY_DN3314_c0_g1~~TRINITY_DN3314_c0_g1_i1.p1  ORF type:complete len:204 (+),score=35.23 TRINITY_DN3314_c0_g1_i1:45-614(+)